MGQYSRVCAEINLDRLEHNIEGIESLIRPGTKLCAVIKADGYGHGAVPIAGLLEDRDKVWGYAVATAEEAFELRGSGIKKPILILGCVFDEDIDAVIGQDIRATVFSMESAQKLSEAARRAGKPARIHIKIDTGMSRIGFPPDGDTADVIAQISGLPCIEIEGIFTHFATADSADKTFTDVQASRFLTLIEELGERGIAIPVKHMANSAGIIDLPKYDLDMVRAGIIIYGLWPSDEVIKDRIDLSPVMALKSHVVQVKTIEEGTPVSYGGTYRAAGRMILATVPVGYADGYPRSLSNCGYVLIHGKRAPICGRVCMDYFMADVTDIEDVRASDEVTLIGRDGEEEITMEELGDISGRFNYEFACDIGKRVPRVYVRREPSD